MHSAEMGADGSMITASNSSIYAQHHLQIGYSSACHKQQRTYRVGPKSVIPVVRIIIETSFCIWFRQLGWYKVAYIIYQHNSDIIYTFLT